MHRTTHAIASLAIAAAACSDSASVDRGRLDTQRVTPDLPGQKLDVPAYSGTNNTVQDAQSQYYDGFSLHANVIRPTCGPINGVCHNAKEFPDLHTPANFVGAIGAPCNIQSATASGIYDRCERPGDRFKLDGDQAEIEIGYLEYLPGDFEGDDPQADSPGLHIYLAGQVRTEREAFSGEGQFIRTFVNDSENVQDLPYFTFRSRFWVLADAAYEHGNGQPGTHLFARVPNYRQRDIEALLSVGVVEGDANHNGVLGARMDGNPIQMLRRGRPEESYLVGRMRGVLGGEPVPGSRMPLANEPLDSTEMLALFCFLEGLEERDGPVNMQDPIDYENCSYAKRPEELEMLGTGVSWGGRIKRILEFNCGGCHSGDNPQGDLDLKDGDVFSRILESSNQLGALKLVEPGQPLQSYLWLKLNGDESIVGAQMPIDPLNGDRTLSARELADIKKWIEEGALPGGEDTPAPDASVEEPTDNDASTQPPVNLPMDAAMPAMEDANVNTPDAGVATSPDAATSTGDSGA